MDHAFEIGGNYRNRRGRYEVIELEGSRMVIRYSDGDTLEADVKTQWRIWQNTFRSGATITEQGRKCNRGVPGTGGSASPGPILMWTLTRLSE